MNKENSPEELRYNFTPKVAGLADFKYAATISEWTEKAGTMLPKTPDEIAELMLEGRSVIVVNWCGEVVSHVSAPYIYIDGSVEIGGLCTGPEFWGHGAALLATNYLLDVLRKKYPGQKIFALANPKSAKLFEKIGAEKIQYSDLPPDVYEYCENCPINPSPYKGTKSYVFMGCCDTPYSFNNLVVNHHS